MATATLYATSTVSGACTTPNNAHGAADGTYTTDTDATSWTHRWNLSRSSIDPASLNGTQTLTIRTRKNGTGGASGTPTYTVNLYEGGSLVGQLGTTTSVTSITSQDDVFTWTPTSSGVSVDIELVTTAAGGGPSVRAAVQVDSLTWDATYTPGAIFTATASGTSTSTGSAQIRMENVATASGTSTSTGSLTALKRMGVVLTGSSTSSGSGAIRSLIQPVLTGTSTSTGSAAARVAFIPTASGTSTSTGTLAAGLRRPATMSGTSTSSGSAAVGIRLPPVSAEASSTSSGTLAASISLPTQFIGWGIPL